MLFYTEALTDAFNDLFDDIEEIRDICKHGAEDGTPKFTNYQETAEFFDKYEDDIEDVCYDILGIDYLSELAKGETCVLGLVNKLVWFAVETYCHNKLQHLESLALV